MLLTLLLAQAATSLPDIEINASVRARALTIAKKGEAVLSVRAAPEGGNLVDVQAPTANGRKTIRNLAVTVRAEARIADPARNVAGPATTAPK